MRKLAPFNWGGEGSVCADDSDKRSVTQRHLWDRSGAMVIIRNHQNASGRILAKILASRDKNDCDQKNAMLSLLKMTNKMAGTWSDD